MIIAVSGLTYDHVGNKGSAGAGKDTVSDRLVQKHGFQKLACADPMKRFVQEIFGFSLDQLWGPSECRNAVDPRYLRMPVGSLGTLAGDPNPAEDVYLTPRYALQRLGTEWARDCYPDVWVSFAMKIAKSIEDGSTLYDPVFGPRHWPATEAAYPKSNAVISDMRFRNEFDYVRASGGKVVRVVRPVDKILDGNHQSENDLANVDDSEFDYVIAGKAYDLGDLLLKVDRMAEDLGVITGQCCKRDYDADGNCDVHRPGK